MKVALLSLTLILTLCACAPNCQPKPTKALGASPFENLRLSALIVEPARAPGQEHNESNATFYLATHYDALQFDLALPIIGELFKQPQSPGYAAAPAVHVLCTVDDLRVSTQGYFSDTPAQFFATLSLVDPGTNKVLLSKSCRKTTSSTATKPTPNYCGQSQGYTDLEDAIRQCALEFSWDVNTVAIQAQPNNAAALDGTLVEVSGAHTAGRFSGMSRMFLGNAKITDDVTMTRIALDILPNAVKRNVMQSNNLFTNTANNSYKLVTTITDYDISFFSHWGHYTIKYTANTKIIKNGVAVATFDYSAKEFLIAERDQAFSKHAAAISDYLRKNAADIQKK